VSKTSAGAGGTVLVAVLRATPGRVWHSLRKAFQSCESNLSPGLSARKRVFLSFLPLEKAPSG